MTDTGNNTKSTVNTSPAKTETKKVNPIKKALSPKSLFSLNILTSDIKRAFKLGKEAKVHLSEKDNREIVGVEDFETMITRMGITDADLLKKTEIAKTQSIIYGAAVVFFLLWVIYLWSIPAIFSGTCAIIIASMLWFKWSLRLYRLRNRDLVGYKEFLKEEWYMEWLK